MTFYTSLVAAMLLLSGIYQLAYAEPVFSSRKFQMPDGISAAVEIVHRDNKSSGGFSTLWVSPDCESLITISDYSQSSKRGDLNRSAWFEAKILYDEAGNLNGVNYIRSGQLMDMDGKTVPGAVEAMAWDGQGFLIAFDNRGQIYRYAGSSPSGDVFANKPVVAYEGENLAVGNAGLESLAVLPDGRVFALWEKDKWNDQAVAWLMSEQQIQTFTYEAEANPGGATTLADGSLLVLERQFYSIFSGIQVRLVQLGQEMLSGSNTVLKGKVLFDVKSMSLDNFEGLSACRKDNRQLVFAITDNNGDWDGSQGTLLMMIELE